MVAVQRRPSGHPAFIFGLILSLFLVPAVAAWVLYAYADRWRPMGTTNYGDLVVPVQPLTGVTLQELNGQTLDATYLRGKWTLVYIGDSRCADDCRKTLHDLRQVRLALGDDTRRVQRLFVLTNTADVEGLRGVLAEHPGMAVAFPKEPDPDGFLRLFQQPGEGSGPVAGRVYVVDPLGNLMMSYPPGQIEPRNLFNDLRRLLKVSQVG